MNITREQIEQMKFDLGCMVEGETIWLFPLDNEVAPGRIRIHKDKAQRWVCYEHDPVTGRTDGYGGEVALQTRMVIAWILSRVDVWNRKEAVA